MRKLTAPLTLLMAVLPTAAFAYVGPGAGLGLLGALWALVAAIGTALVFVLAWPIRNMLRRRRADRAAASREPTADAPHAGAPQTGPGFGNEVSQRR